MTMHASSTLFAVAAALVAVAAAAAPPPNAKAKAPPLPEPEVRVRMIAPSAQGAWTLRIDNEGAKTVRIPADIRLLSFDVEEIDDKGKHKTTTCSLPASLRPDAFPDKRALLLTAGHTYLESFDPRLFCFGKNARLLAGGNVVRTRFGWSKPKLASAKIAGPFAIEDTEYPPTLQAIKEATAPTDLLSFQLPEAPADAGPFAKSDDAKKDDPKKDDAKKDDPKKDDAKKDDAKKDDAKKDDLKKDDPKKDAAPVDESGPRLDVLTDPFIDVSAPEHASITVTAMNSGHRPMTIALLPRMIGLQVTGPDGAFRCSPDDPTHAVPREMFHTLKPGAKSTMTILVREICPTSAFKRPGLYTITATVHARENGSEQNLDAFTAISKAKAPSLLRLLSGPEPFYAGEPHAIETPKLEADDTSAP